MSAPTPRQHFVSRIRPLHATLVIAALATAWACGDYLTDIGHQQGRLVRTLALEPHMVEIPAADTIRLDLTAFDQDQEPFDSLPPGTTITWTSSDTAVATVDSTGLVTARYPGESLVTAKVAGPRIMANIAARVTVYQDTVVVREVHALLAMSDTTLHGTVGDTIPDPVLVRAVDEDGEPVPGAAIEFVTEDDEGVATPTLATTDSAGLASTTWVLGTQAGDQLLEARLTEGEVAPLRFTATAAPGQAATIAISPDSAEIAVPGDTLRLTAATADSFGNPTDDLPAWASLDTLVATVDSIGLVTAVDSGIAAITATLGEIADTAWVGVLTAKREPPSLATLHSILAVGDTAHAGTVGDTIAEPIRISAITEDGAPVPGITIEFATNDGEGEAAPASAVTDSLGIAATTWVLGPKAGEQQLIARVPDSEFAPVHLTANAAAGPLAVLTIAPSNAKLAELGDTVSLEAAGADRFGNPVPVEPSWSSLDTLVATVVATAEMTGLATAVDSGIARIVARDGEVADTARVRVLAGKPEPPLVVHELRRIARIDLDGTVGEPLAEPIRVSAIAEDGTPVPEVAIEFATTEGSGMATPTRVMTDSTGIAATTWTLGSRTGEQQLLASIVDSEIAPVQFTANATAGPLAEVSVTPDDTALDAPGDTIRLLAAGADRFGNLVPIDPSWRSLDTLVATVDIAGLVTAIDSGTARIVAQAGAIADTARVRVLTGKPEPPPVVHELLPASDTIVHGTVGAPVASELRVRAVDQRGNGFADLEIRFTIAAGDGSVSLATVRTDAAGYAATTWTLGPRPGKQTVEARAAAGQIAPVRFTANAAAGPLDALAITPKSASLEARGETITLTAAGADRFGNPVPASPIWTSLDMSVATVDQNGIVTAVDDGTARIVASVGAIADTALVTVAIPVYADDPYESNNTFETAWAIHAPSDPALNAATGRAGLPFTTVADELRRPAVDHLEDPDFYSFKLDRAASVTITIEHLGGYGTLHLDIHEGLHRGGYAGGTTIVRPGHQESVTLSLRGAQDVPPGYPNGEPGLYYVVVTGTDLDAGPAPYRLRITTNAIGSDDFVNGDLTTAFDFNDFLIDAIFNAPRDLGWEAAGRLRGAGGEPRDVDLYAIWEPTPQSIQSQQVPPVVAITNMHHSEPIELRLYGISPDTTVDFSQPFIVNVPPRTIRTVEVPYPISYSAAFAVAAVNPGATNVQYDLCVGGKCRMDFTWAPEWELTGTVGVTSFEPFRIVVFDYYEQRVPNAWVHFSADEGALSASSVMTDANGEALLYYTPPEVPGTYEIRYWLTNAMQADQQRWERLQYVAEPAWEGDHPVIRITTGASHTCVVTNRNDAFCWGNGEQGRLGDGEVANSTTPVRVDQSATGLITEISAGGAHTCALNQMQQAYCWGDNSLGQLGIGDEGKVAEVHRPFPVEQAGSPPFVAIAAGTRHTCAIASNRQTFCWGNNASGQLGFESKDTIVTTPTPVEMSSVHGNFVKIAAGYAHTCALTDTERVYCWGANDFHQLGHEKLETHEISYTPIEISYDGWAGPLRDIAAGFQHTCAVSDKSALLCWGRNDYGQLGLGMSSHSEVNFREVNGEFSTVTAGGMRTCALDREGWAYCWGQEPEARFGGIGPGRFTPVPTRVNHKTPYGTISTGTQHTCAATPSGLVDCWGRNTSGELGIGSTEPLIPDPYPVRW